MVRYAKPEILDHLGTSHCVIEASAGTGKTYTLEHLIVQFLLDGIPLEQILVVTFTKKATLELISRVRAKLEELANLAKDACKDGEPAWDITQSQQELLRQAVNAFDRATISTIHGFCQQLLQDSAFEGARLFQQEAISKEEAFDHVFRDLVRTRYAAQDEELFKVALGDLGGLEPLRELLRDAYKERDCLSIPSPNQPKEILEAFPVDLAMAFIAENSNGPLKKAFQAAGCSTRSFTAMAGRLQKVLDGISEARDLGVPESFWVDSERLEELRDAKQVANFSLPALTGDAGRLGKAYTRLVGLDLQHIWVSAFLPPLLECLERYKREEGLYDFDDMIGLVHQAVLSEAGASLVQRLRDRFRVALIDEFQDTDRKQWEIFQKVFLGDGSSSRLILVGDPKQAIYGFRSGDLPTYTRALMEMKRITGNSPLQLRTNYRSTPEVIEAYNDVLRETDGVSFFTGGNVPHYRDEVDCGKKSLRLLDGDGQVVKAMRVVDVTAGKSGMTKRACARALVGALKETLGCARFGKDADFRFIQPEDVYVLTRTSAEGRVMQAALEEAGIPSAFYRQDGLFDGPEAEACRDLLLAIEAPYHEGRRAKALLGPFFGLSFEEAEACRELPEDHLILKRLGRWRELAHRGRFGEFFHRIVSESGVTRRLLFLEEGQRTLTNLIQILELLQREALGRHGTLLDLAIQVQRWIDGVERPTVEDGDVQRLERESGAVQILTMHKAKGLEAPIVVLFGGISAVRNAKLSRYHVNGNGDRKAWIGPVKSAPPDVQSWIEQEEVEEGERLLYVALTRAKAQLILPRYVLGDEPPHGRSPFEKGSGDPKGPYACVNRRLRALLGAPDQVKMHRHIQHSRSPEFSPNPTGDLSERLAGWIPEEPPSLELPDFRKLAVQGRPTWLWSFTSLQKGFEKSNRESPDELQDPSQNASDGPRGGAKLGSCVHAGFQQVDLQTFDGREFETWKRDPRVQAMARTCLPAGARDAALAWIHAGLGQELPLPAGGTVVIAEADRILRELDFMTPYPGRRDFLHGSMDVLFQLDGKAYLVDWKTNDLKGDYSPEALEAKMDEDYLLQAKIYTLAACRFLGIDSAEAYEQGFGGILYVFLRGLPEGGVWTCRPSWVEVLRWEMDVRDCRIEDLIPFHAGGEAKDA